MTMLNYTNSDAFYLCIYILHIFRKNCIIDLNTTIWVDKTPTPNKIHITAVILSDFTHYDA